MKIKCPCCWRLKAERPIHDRTFWQCNRSHIIIIIMKWNNAICLGFFLKPPERQSVRCITHKTIVFWIKVHVMHLFRVSNYYYSIYWHLFVMRKEIDYFIVFNFQWEWEWIVHWLYLGWISTDIFDFLQNFQFRFSISSSAELMFHEMRRMQVRLIWKCIFPHNLQPQMS